LISDVPTIFVSGSLDTQTPPHQAERVRWGFLNSAHIVVENAGHESTLDVPAVLASIARFMRGEAVASQSVSLPMPKFRGPATR
jgi:pimeloyl-ACP methyl ester carboxylesterase